MITKKISFLIVFLMVFCIQTNMKAQQTPENPIIYSISIDNTNPVITWFSNKDGNTDGYTIYRGYYDMTYLKWDSITSNFSVTDTVFTDLSVSACEEVQLYKVSAFKQLTGTSPWLLADTLKTILLYTPQFNICANTASLSWTTYTNMTPAPDGYKIFASTDGGNTFAEIGENPLSDTTFTHAGLLPDMLYTYKIQAFYNHDPERISATCFRQIESKTYQKPEFVRIVTATVEDNSFVKIIWEADISAPISSFDVKRRDESQTLFTTLQSIEDNINYQPATQYDDFSADFGSTSYFYKIAMWDSCGNPPSVYSDIARTIYLTGAPQTGFTNRLEWNHYEGWEEGVDSYNIYRNGTLIGNVPGNRNDFSDEVAAFSGQGGKFTYFVEGYEHNGNNATSRSNQITLEMETRISVPNAFIPDAQPPDNEFKPELIFIDDKGYELLIFNKWGEMIFTTKNPETGWDGKQNGQILPSGAYVYLIKYRTPEGQNLEKRGTITLIR